MSKKRPQIAEIESELTRLKVKRSRLNGIKFFLIASLIAAAGIIIATNLWFPVLRVVGSSMQPLLKNDDIIVCFDTKKSIESGDVIAFYHNQKILLKRVVGMPGDIIEIDSTGKLFVNGEEKYEPYASALSLEPCDITFPIQVPENSYFVLGDQRLTSMDSRSEAVGMISEDNLIGKAVLRVWPVDTITTFE